MNVLLVPSVISAILGPFCPSTSHGRSVPFAFLGLVKMRKYVCPFGAGRPGISNVFGIVIASSFLRFAGSSHDFVKSSCLYRLSYSMYGRIWTRQLHARAFGAPPGNTSPGKAPFTLSKL